MKNRILDAAKQALSLEGLVGALIGGGVWAIAAAAFTQIPNFGLLASLAVGAGVGLLAVAGFIWLVVMPRRAGEQERTGVLRHSARQHLLALASEGSRKWTGVTLINPEGSGERAEWQQTVYLFLLDAFGRQVADEFEAAKHPRSQVQMLNELNRNLDHMRIRPTYRGGEVASSSELVGSGRAAVPGPARISWSWGTSSTTATTWTSSGNGSGPRVWT